MAKGQNRPTREVRKPKKEKVAAPANISKGASSPPGGKKK